MCTGKICSPGILTRQRTIRFLLGLQCGGGRSYTEKKQTYERLGSWHACCDLYPATCAAACVWPYRIGAVVLLFLPASVLWPGKPPWASLSVTVAVSVDLYFVLHSSMQCGRLHNPNGKKMSDKRRSALRRGQRPPFWKVKGSLLRGGLLLGYLGPMRGKIWKN